MIKMINHFADLKSRFHYVNGFILAIVPINGLYPTTITQEIIKW